MEYDYGDWKLNIVSRVIEFGYCDWKLNFKCIMSIVGLITSCSIMIWNVIMYYILTPLIGYIFNLSFFWSLIIIMVLQSLLLACICFQLIRMCLSLVPADYIDKLNEDHQLFDPDWYSNMYPVLIQKMISVKVNIVSCITVGPPTVGKTTLKEQLLLPDDDISLPLSERPSERPPSTPTIDSVKKVGIRLQQSNAKNQANQFIANNGTWKSLTKGEEFIAAIASIADVIFAIEKRNDAKLRENKRIPCHCFQINCFFVCLCTAPTWVASVLNSFIGTSSTGIMASTSFLFCIIAISVVTAALIVIAISCCFYKILFHKEENLVLQALKNKNTVELQKFFRGNLIIHFRDTGGQPEFHEVVPALVPHSNLYLLMFNLNEELNTQYNVTYKASEDDITDPYQSSFTVKQTLLQLLASIQSLNHSSQGTPSNAFIIGTHKDLLVDKETCINQIQQELEKEIKGTDWYTSDTILTTPDGHLMLPINTYNKDDINQVKNVISKSIAIRQIPVPIQWLALYFHIEEMKKPVMKINEFKNLAHKCNIDIDDGNKFDEVVTFLQSTVGSIRYFGNVLELKDIVITDPQILFNLVNDLIVCTFNFKNLRTVGSRHQIERFRSSGRFKKKSLKRCEVVKNGSLTEDQVISILQHLNIIAPVGINDEGEEEYFLPCVLVHAPVSTQPTSINTTDYSPLLITFKCGYIQRGVFSCLISSILCTKSQWVLASEKIYRNQIKLYGRNCGHFVFIRNYIKYLEVTIMLCQGSTIINVPFAEIKELLSDHLTCVMQKLGYSFKDTQFLFSFYCSCGSQPHPAVSVPNANPPHTKCTFDPSLTTTMTSDKVIWFQSKYDSPF